MSRSVGSAWMTGIGVGNAATIVAFSVGLCADDDMSFRCRELLVL